jgi:glycosyltransferase involved in cell wall biosynthesis
MRRRLTIGLDAKRIVSNGTGLGSYGRTLSNDLSREEDLQLRLYAPDEGRGDLRGQVAERDNLRFCYPDGHPNGIGKALWRTWGIVSQLQDDRIDIYHGLSGELPIGISKTRIRTVVTIHDLIFMRHPEYYHWIDRKIYEWKFRKTLNEADRIVAISECTRRDICELGGVDEDKIDLIYQSCAARFTADTNPQHVLQVVQKYGLPERYVLSVGSVEERKNTLLALKALHWLPGDVQLVLVGRSTPYTKKLISYAQKNSLAHRLHLLHGVPDDDLPAIYARAEVFVYPSRYEGFGIPIIEAVRMGLPVVGCTGSCLEEAGGPDNFYVDPDRPEDMATAITRLLKGAEGRQQRISLSQGYISRFEGSDAARCFNDLYHSMINE